MKQSQVSIIISIIDQATKQSNSLFNRVKKNVSSVQDYINKTKIVPNIDVSKAQSSFDKLNARKATMNVSKDVETLNQKLDSVQKTLDELQKKTNNFGSSTSRTISSLTEKFNALNSAIQLIGNINKAPENIGKLIKILGYAYIVSKKLDNQKVSLKIDAHLGTINTLEKQLKKLHHEIKTLSDTSRSFGFNKISNFFDQLENAVSKSQKGLKSYQQSLKEFKSYISDDTFSSKLYRTQKGAKTAITRMGLKGDYQVTKDEGGYRFTKSEDAIKKMIQSMDGGLIKIGQLDSSINQFFNRIKTTSIDISKSIGVKALSFHLSQIQKDVDKTLNGIKAKLSTLNLGNAPPVAVPNIPKTLTIDTDSTQKGLLDLISLLNKVKERVDLIRSKFLNITPVKSAFDDFQKSMQGAAHYQAALSTTEQYGRSITKALKSPVKTAMDFEQAMANVGSISIDAPKGSKEYSSALDKLTTKARQLGAASVYSSIETAQGMKELGAMGFTVQGILKGSEGLLDTAAAADADMASAAKISSGILRSFEMDESKLGYVGDVLAKATNVSAANFTDLGETMKYVAPIANSLGVSLEKMGAITSLLANKQIKGSEAGTALRAMFLRLAAPTKKTEQALAGLQKSGFALPEVGMGKKELKDFLEEQQTAFDELKRMGVQIEDKKTGNMRQIDDILADIIDRAQNLSKVEQMDMLKKIFGEEPAAAMQILLTQMKGGAKEFKTFLAQFEKDKVTGSAKDVATKRLDTFKGKLIELSGAAEDTQISLGNALLPTLSKVAELATVVLRPTNDWIQAHSTLTSTLLLGTGTLGVTLVGVALLGKSIMVATTALAGLKLATVALLSPMGMLGMVAVGIATVIYKNWAPISSFIRGFSEGFGDAIQPALPLLSSMANFLSPLANLFRNFSIQVKMSSQALVGFYMAGHSIGFFIGEMLSSGIKGMAAFSEGILAGGKKIGQAIKNVFETYISPFLPHSDALAGPLSTLTQSGKALILTFISGVRSVGRLLLVTILKILTPIGQLLMKSSLISGFVAPKITAFSRLVKGLGFLLKIFKVFGVAQSAVLKLVSTLGSLASIFTFVSTSIGAMGQIMGASLLWLDQFILRLSPLQRYTLAFAGGLFFITSTTPSLRQALKETGQAVQNFWSGLSPNTQSVLTTIASFSSSVALAAAGFYKLSMFTAFFTAINAFKEDIGTSILFVKEWFSSLSTGQKILVGVIGTLAAVVPVGIAIASSLAMVPSVIGVGLALAFTSISSFFYSIAEYHDSIVSFVTKIKSYLSSLGTLGTIIGTALVVGLVGAASAGVGWLIKTFTTMKILKKCMNSPFMSCMIPDRKEIIKRIKASSKGVGHTNLIDNCSGMMGGPCTNQINQTAKLLEQSQQRTASQATNTWKQNFFSRLKGMWTHYFVTPIKNTMGQLSWQGTKAWAKGKVDSARQHYNQYLERAKSTGIISGPVTREQRGIIASRGMSYTNELYRRYDKTMGLGDLPPQPGRQSYLNDRLMNQSQSAGMRRAWTEAKSPRSMGQRFALFMNDAPQKMSQVWNQATSAMRRTWDRGSEYVGRSNQSLTSKIGKAWSSMSSSIGKAWDKGTEAVAKANNRLTSLLFDRQKQINTSIEGPQAAPAKGKGKTTAIVATVGLLAAGMMMSNDAKASENTSTTTESMNLLSVAIEKASQAFAWLKSNMDTVLSIAIPMVMSMVEVTTLLTFMAKGVGVVAAAWAGWQIGSWLYSFSSVREMAVTVIGTIVEMGQTLTSVPSIIQNSFSQAKSLLENFSLREIGKKIIQSLIDGIKDLGGQVVDTLKSYIPGYSSAIDTTSNLIGKMMGESGEKTVETFGKGVANSTEKVEKPVGGMLSAVRNYLPFSDAKVGPLSDLTTSGQSLVSTIGAGVESAGSNLISSPLANKFSSVISPLSSQSQISDSGPSTDFNKTRLNDLLNENNSVTSQLIDKDNSLLETLGLQTSSNEKLSTDLVNLSTQLSTLPQSISSSIASSVGSVVGSMVGGVGGSIMAAATGNSDVGAMTEAATTGGVESAMTGGGGSAGGRELGSVSRPFESGKSGVNTISTGVGDAGGKSYGEHQLASKTGTLAAYINSGENAKWKDRFKGVPVASAQFDAIWKDIAAKEGPAFAEAQHAFIKRTHYDPAAAYAKQKGFDTNNRAVQEMLFSGSVQHGKFRKVIDMWASRVGDPKQASNQKLIDTFYSARTDYVKTTGANVGNRYQREREAMLKFSASDGMNKQVSSATAAQNNATGMVASGSGSGIKVDNNLRVKGGMSGQAFAGGQTHEGTVLLAKSIQGTLGSQVNRFTAFNDEYHQGTSSKHTKGTALDFTIKNAAQSAAVAEQVRQIGAKTGVNLKVLDEYKNPTKRATGGHIHVNFENAQDAQKFVTAMGGKKMEKQSEPQSNIKKEDTSPAQRTDLPKQPVSAPINSFAAPNSFVQTPKPPGLPIGGVLPQLSTLPSLPIGGALPQLPQLSTLPSLPTGGVLPQLPQLSTLPSLPTGGALPQLPQLSTLLPQPPATNNGSQVNNSGGGGGGPVNITFGDININIQQGNGGQNGQNSSYDLAKLGDTIREQLSVVMNEQLRRSMFDFN